MNLPAVRSMPLSKPAQQPQFAAAAILLWCAPVLIAGAELAGAYLGSPIGIALYGALLVALVILGALARGKPVRLLAVALMLVPVQRICALALPLSDWTPVVQYVAIALPALAGAFLIMRQARISQSALGLRMRSVPLQLLFGASGPFIGACLYYVGAPINRFDIVAPSAWLYILFGSIVCVALADEIVFRGVLQAAALPVLRRSAVEYIALVFVAMHLATLQPGYLVLLFCFAVTFGYVVRWSESLLGVIIAHALANLTLMAAIPLLAPTSNVFVSGGVVTLLSISALCGLIACVVLFYQAQQGSVPWASEPVHTNTSDTPLQATVLPMPARSAAPAKTPDAAPDPVASPPVARARALDKRLAARLRAERKRQKRTYYDLVERTGLSMETVASIEHALVAPTDEELFALAHALGTTIEALEQGSIED